jgi:hypothetical protein
VLLLDFAKTPGSFNPYHAAANWVDGLRFAFFNRFVS